MSVQKSEFTIEVALKYQQEHLNFYKETLKPKYFEILKAEVEKRNEIGYKSAYDVCRGADIDNIYANILRK